MKREHMHGASLERSLVPGQVRGSVRVGILTSGLYSIARLKEPPLSGTKGYVKPDRPDPLHQGRGIHIDWDICERTEQRIRSLDGRGVLCRASISTLRPSPVPHPSSNFLIQILIEGV
jgi:hypothetical protein